MANIIVQPKVKNAQGTYDTIDIVTNQATEAINTQKVQNVDLSSDGKAQFGDYIVEKKKILWEGNTTVTSSGISITLTNGTIAVGDTIELVWGGLTGYPSTGYRIDRFKVNDLSSSGTDMSLMGAGFYGSNYFYIGSANVFTLAEDTIGFRPFNIIAIEGIQTKGATLKSGVDPTSYNYYVYKISKIIE